MNRARPVCQSSPWVSGFPFLCCDTEGTCSDDLCRGKSENSFRAYVGERLGGSEKPPASVIYPIAEMPSFRVTGTKPLMGSY